MYISKIYNFIINKQIRLKLIKYIWLKFESIIELTDLLLLLSNFYNAAVIYNSRRYHSAIISKIIKSREISVRKLQWALIGAVDNYPGW